MSRLLSNGLQAANGFCSCWLTPARVYLWVMATFGLAVLVANPPFQAPDEYEHYFRAIQVSQGDLMGEKRGTIGGGEIPVLAHNISHPGEMPGRSDIKATREFFAHKLNPLMADWSAAQRRWVDFPHTFYYSPLGYLPQSSAIALGKLLDLGPLLLFYAARLAGLVTCVIFGYVAITRAPAFQWPTALFLLCPTTLYQAGSIAPDGLLITGSVLLVSLLVRAACDGSRAISAGEMTVMLGLGAVLPVAKFVYFPISALIPVLLWDRFPNARARVQMVGAWIVVCAVPVVLWSKAIAASYVVGRTDIPIDPVAQMANMMSHPLAFFGVVGDSVELQAAHTYRSLVGVLGWNDTPMPPWFYPAFGLGFISSLVLQSPTGARVAAKTRIVLVLGSSAAVLAVYAAMYAHWSSPGAATVEGIVGRYLLPALAPLVVSFPALFRAQLSAGVVNAFGTCLSVTGAAVCLGAMIARYYPV